MGRLTKRDQEILAYIKSFMIENGRTPTMREIGAGIHLYSLNTVNMHFHRLVDQGYIFQFGNKYSVKGMKYIEVE